MKNNEESLKKPKEEDEYFGLLGGCIELGFWRILKDFLVIKKSLGIQSRF